MKLAKDSFPTKAAYAYDVLRERILSGYYRPGEDLVITRLGHDLGVSESAIREAVNRLQGERLLEITPHTGVRVSALTEREAAELFEIRITLECLAARKALGHLTPDHFTRLAAVNDALRRSLLEKDLAAAAALNRQFHEIVYRCAGSEWLLRLIQQLWDHSERLRASLLVLGEDRRDIQVVQHLAILDALSSGDPERVTAAVTEHLNTALAVYQEYLRIFASISRLP